MNKAKNPPDHHGQEGFVRLCNYAPTSMMIPDLSSAVMRSSQMVICLTQHRTSDSSNSVR